jgi:transcriptional regulator with XRE-family HTH domain
MGEEFLLSLPPTTFFLPLRIRRSSVLEWTPCGEEVAVKRSGQIDEIVARVRSKMIRNGVALSFLARAAGTSRQYIWQILHGRTFLSRERIAGIERLVDSIIERQAHVVSFGDRLRAARRSAGLTLKEVAAVIGYTWVAVQRWEKDVCLPKPGVLWHLASVYGLPGGWLTEGVNGKGTQAARRANKEATDGVIEGIIRVGQPQRTGRVAAAHHIPNPKHSEHLFGQRKRA